jgi:2-keto-3-deoxy-L-fuconate dehydrogenase
VTKHLGRLAGKTAVITAAAQGIGRASAIAMAREGAKVIATDINAKLLDQLHAEHPEIETRLLDVLDNNAIATFAASMHAPDILFNCSGFVHNGTILETTDKDWDFSFAINVRAHHALMQVFTPTWLDRGTGVVVNMASVAGAHKGAPNRYLYGATKAAVVGLTKAYAADYVSKGIRCNCICPGTVETPSLYDRMRATGDFEKSKAAFIARQPMGRLAQPEEIANLVVYLSSDESAFVTGQAFVIDGGWTG